MTPARFGILPAPTLRKPSLTLPLPLETTTLIKPMPDHHTDPTTSKLKKIVTAIVTTLLVAMMKKFRLVLI